MASKPASSPPSDERNLGPSRELKFVAPSKRVVVLSMSCVSLAMFLAALSQTVVATTLPLMVADLGGFDRYTWAATSYMVAATVAYPIVGSLSDIYGRKRFLVVGLAIFIVGSILVGLSASMTQVISFRVIQGIGGGIVMTCSYVSIADLFPPEDRGKLQGLISAIYGFASVAGPMLGGVVTDILSWHWAFILIALAGIPVLALTARVYPRRGNNTSARPQLDYAGMIVLIFAVAPILLALSAGGVQYDWDSVLILSLLAFGLVMTGVFIALEARVTAPILPLGICTHPVVGLASIVTFLISAGLYGSILFLPLFFQAVLNLSATTSGNLLAPMLLAMVAGGIVAGFILSRSRGGGLYRSEALVGTGLMALGMFLLASVDETTSVFECVCYIVVAGFGFGGTVATLSVAVQNSVPFALVGTATAVLQFFRSIGGMLGLAVLGAAMARDFSIGFNQVLPKTVRDMLTSDQLNTLSQDPSVLIEPSVLESLGLSLSSAEWEVVRLTVASVLTSTLNEIFFMVACLTALAFGTAIFFRLPKQSKAVSPPSD